MIDIVVHAHARVCGYVAYKCEYCARVGVLILIVFVTVTKEVYNNRIVNMMVNKMMNILVDILSFWSSYSSVVGGTDGNKLRFWRKYFVFCQNAETSLGMFATRIKDKIHYNYNEDSQLKIVSYMSRLIYFVIEFLETSDLILILVNAIICSKGERTFIKFVPHLNIPRSEIKQWPVW